MEKLMMQTTNVVDENIKRIGELFPNCLTERLNDEGKPKVAMWMSGDVRGQVSDIWTSGDR